MLIKKLAVPLINEKILNQAEYCYIASAAISDAGFDFIRSRIPPRCKMEIITGLDVATSPGVLKRIWKHYQERISLKIYSKNFFHANVYLFDLPFRKSVAFVGSGHFTLEGIKDSEEIFDRITDPKEIEALKSWFTGYYEFAEQLTEELINEYDLIYPSLKQREIASKQDKREMMELTTRGFSWDSIKFKNQYFKKEDYLVFSNSNSAIATPEIQEARTSVRNKLQELHELIRKHIAFLKLQEEPTTFQNPDTENFSEQRIRSFSIAYGRRQAELMKYATPVSFGDFLILEIAIKQKDMVIALTGSTTKGKLDREHFRNQMNEVEYRTRFFQSLTGLGPGYWIEVFGERKGVETWQNEEMLWEFTKADDWRHYSFAIGRNFSPGDTAIATDAIAITIEKELDKLVTLRELMSLPI